MAKTSSAKARTPGALDYLANPAKFPAQAVCCVFGDDAYLKSEVLATIRTQVLGGDEESFSLSTFIGRDVQLRDVLDALATGSLFGSGRRLVVVEQADPFVTEFRSDLEEYVTRPARDAVLVLDVKTWPSNTRLAKAVAATGMAIDCKAPNERQLKTWVVARAKSAHNVRLDAAAVDVLLELVPPELGVLNQELAKLALLVADDRAIDVKLVQENVGGWRARTAWEMSDAVAEGRAAKAIAQLDRLITAGEKPQGLLPQMASSLRRFATAVRLIESAEADRRRLPLRDALAQAGVPPFRLNDAEKQLQQIGRHRAKELSGWLLAADLAMKGHNSSDERARLELERLIVRLAAETGKRTAGSDSRLISSRATGRSS
jgi:DNA polymerase III subunit delta